MAGKKDKAADNSRLSKVREVLAASSYDSLVEDVTDAFIADVLSGNGSVKMSGSGLVSRKAAKIELLQEIRTVVEIKNAGMVTRAGRFPVPTVLDTSAIARLMVAFDGVRRVNLNPAGDGGLKLGVYDGQGVYDMDFKAIVKIALKYNSMLKKSQIEGDLMMQLESLAPVRELTVDPDLILFENGMFDYRTKTLVPYDDSAFDPDRYVFTRRSHVNMPDTPHNKSYTTKQGVTITGMTFFDTLSDNPAVVNLIKQMAGASLRPNVSWDISFILYNRGGSAGKGTVCEVMESIVGSRAYRSISLKQMEATFTLEGIEHVQLITGHENAVSGYLDDLITFKLLVTGDSLNVNPKHKPMYTAKFKGLVVQCCNALPKVSDKTGSFWRRLCFVPFDKSFKAGEEDKAVKDVFLKDPEVLEDIVYGLMHMDDYYAFDIPDVCSEAMHETVRANSSAAAFAYDVLNPDGEGWHGHWDAYSFKDHLFPVYKAWYAENYPTQSGRLQYQNFRRELIEYLENHSEFGWEVPANRFEFGDRENRLACGASSKNLMFTQYLGVDKVAPTPGARISGIRRIASPKVGDAAGISRVM